MHPKTSPQVVEIIPFVGLARKIPKLDLCPSCSSSVQYCKYVWLGLYDSRCPMEPDSRDEQRTRDLMIQKYERKRWYVDPEIAMQKMNAERQQSRVVQSPVGNSVAPNSVVSNNVVANNIVAANNLVHSNSAVPDTKPLSSLLGKNSLPLVIHKSQVHSTLSSGCSCAPSATSCKILARARGFSYTPFTPKADGAAEATCSLNLSYILSFVA